MENKPTEEFTYKNKNGKPVEVFVGVWTRPNLRSGDHEMALYMGKSILDNVFDKKVIDEKTKSIHIHYPETWCNIPELQCLVDFIFHFYPNIEKLDIITHSVYIIQNVSSQHMGIYDKPEDYPSGVTKPTQHLAPPQKGFTGLHINGSLVK